MFYRSGWLRCVGLKYKVFGLCFDPACFIGVDGSGVMCVFVSGCVLVYVLAFDNLTPHVLSDGNVEWCSLYLYRVYVSGLSWCSRFR